MARWGLAATGGVVAVLAALNSGGEKKPVDMPKRSEAVSYVDTSTSAATPLVEPIAAPQFPEVKGGETYAVYDARRDALGGSAGYSGGYGCTQDCSGHDAGYEWAEENEITDPDDCSGKSWSFEEGCRSFAEERQGEEGEEDSEE